MCTLALPRHPECSFVLAENSSSVWSWEQAPSPRLSAHNACRLWITLIYAARLLSPPLLLLSCLACEVACWVLRVLLCGGPWPLTSKTLWQGLCKITRQQKPTTQGVVVSTIWNSQTSARIPESWSQYTTDTASVETTNQIPDEVLSTTTEMLCSPITCSDLIEPPSPVLTATAIKQPFLIYKWSNG